jgi:ketosteroid isomerase-like protein
VPDTTEPTALRNQQTVRTWYAALAAEEVDVEAVLSLVTDDVVFHIGGSSSLAGDYIGPDGLVTLAASVSELTGGTHRTELLDLLGTGSHVAARHRWTATRDGASIEMVNLILFRLSGARIAERWEFIEDEVAHDSFWSSFATTPDTAHIAADRHVRSGHPVRVVQAARA